MKNLTRNESIYWAKLLQMPFSVEGSPGWLSHRVILTEWRRCQVVVSLQHWMKPRPCALSHGIFWPHIPGIAERHWDFSLMNDLQISHMTIPYLFPNMKCSKAVFNITYVQGLVPGDLCRRALTHCYSTVADSFFSLTGFLKRYYSILRGNPHGLNFGHLQGFHFTAKIPDCDFRFGQDQNRDLIDLGDLGSW